MSPLLIGVLIAVLILVAVSTWQAPRLTSVILWALIATIFFCSALLLKGPGPFSEKALWLTLAVPLVWMGFQFWVYWERRPWVVTSGLIAISVVCGMVVLFSEPVV